MSTRIFLRGLGWSKDEIRLKCGEDLPSYKLKSGT